MMLTIVGGTYREACDHPAWDRVRGSGLRAAAAVSNLANVSSAGDSPLELITWVSSGQRKAVNQFALACDFVVKSREREQDIEFQYLHALSPPKLYPPRGAIQRAADEYLAVECALVFSLVECAPHVRANRIIYDPQAGQYAIPFSRTGHSAKEVAVVCNLSEANAMLRALRPMVVTKSFSAISVATALRKLDQVSVIVVKDGVRGTTVVTPDGHLHIPSHMTDNVFKIGSGDVFSAIFAMHWSELGNSAFDAAKWSSIATAYYCETRTQVIPSSLDAIEKDIASSARVLSAALDAGRGANDIYLAGPLFTVPQIFLLEEVRRCFDEQRVKVFSPRHDVGLAKSNRDAARVAKADLDGLDKSGIVFAIIDGMDPGTLFELGYAVAKRKKCVIAFGQRVADHDLTMLRGCGCRIYSDLTTAIYHASWAATR